MPKPSLPPTRRSTTVPVRVRDVQRPLTARLYDLDDYGQYYRSSEPRTVQVGKRLHVAATSPDDGIVLPLSHRYGMATEPIVFQAEPLSKSWMIRNNGRTNSLRVQPWGLRPFLLRPQTEVAMPSTDVAIWIPVVPEGVNPGDRGENFRVVIAHTDIPAAIGQTPNITELKAREFSDEQWEALLYFFGEIFAWPPHPAPHVRSTAELNSTLLEPDPRFLSAKGRLIDTFALFRTSRSGQRDWYPPSGRPGAVDAYLPNVERMVELGSLTLPLVWHRRNQLGVRNYVDIDEGLMRFR